MAPENRFNIVFTFFRIFDLIVISTISIFFPGYHRHYYQSSYSANSMITDIYEMIIFSTYLPFSFVEKISYPAVFHQEPLPFLINPQIFGGSNLICQTFCISLQKQGQISAVLAESDNLSWEITILQFSTIFVHIWSERKVPHRLENTNLQKTPQFSSFKKRG